MSTRPQVHVPTCPHFQRSTCPHFQRTTVLQHVLSYPYVHRSTRPHLYKPTRHLCIIRPIFARVHISTVSLIVSRVRESCVAVAIVSYCHFLCHEHIFHLSEERKLQLYTENARGDRPHSPFRCETYFETFYIFALTSRGFSFLR